MNQQIYFVTGKGGVGKSTVAAALALAHARKGRKTLLVELGDFSFYKDYFHLPEIGYKPQNFRENLQIARWSGADSLREYALHLLKIESLYRLFFENKISKTLIQVAPGLPELAILGKITSGPRQHGPAAQHEVLVIDAFSTGHFLSLLRAPGALSQAVRFGPMGEQSRGIDQTLKNSQICHYWLVTLPEDLPVKESIELSQSLEEEFSIQPQWVMNKVLETFLQAEDLQESTGAENETRSTNSSSNSSTNSATNNSTKLSFISYLKKLLHRQETLLSRVKDEQKKRAAKKEVVVFPMLPQSDPWALVESLAERILL